MSKLVLLRNVVRLLFVILWLGLAMWSYIDGEMLKAIFWLLVVLIDKLHIKLLIENNEQ
jgi:hypothetical protein